VASKVEVLEATARTFRWKVWKISVLVTVGYCPVRQLQANGNKVVKETSIEAHVTNQSALSGILENDIRLSKTLLKRLGVAVISSLWNLDLSIQAIESFDPLCVLEDWHSVVKELVIVLDVVGASHTRLPWDLLNV
jgi:hypothetical protein